MSDFDKRAVFVVACQNLAQSVALLARSGIDIIGSHASRDGSHEVALVIAGDRLPETCRRRPITQVDIDVCVQQPKHGFKIMAISEIRCVGPFEDL